MTFSEKLNFMSIFQEVHGMPGFNVKAPFVTTVYQIVVRPETDTMETIISITKDGIQNTFNDVQVTNFF